MGTTHSKFGRRLDEAFRREVAALAAQPGARPEQVARELGVSSCSVSRWRRFYEHHAPAAAAAAAAATAVPAAEEGGGVVGELQRRVRALERENAALRAQRAVLRKALAIVSEATGESEA